MTKNELSRAERVLGLIVAAVIGLGAVAAVAMPMLRDVDEPGIWRWCSSKAGNKYLTCGEPE